MDYSLVPILLSLVVGISGGPAGRRFQESVPPTCSQQCTGSSKFSYAPGTTYEFKYNVETKTQMLGASEDHSTIGISATVDIEVHSKCELILQLRDVTIEAYDSRKFTDQDSNKEFARTLERYPLRFSFQDGIIESVCPDIDDITWSVNIKKGILSAFQNSMENFEVEHTGKERDVSGTCDTSYTLAQRGWLALTIKKSKDLSSCTDRHGYETAIQTTPFRISSGLKSLPILKSSHTCDQEVTSKGTLTSSLCHEIHTFRPFSKDHSGATTETTQRLSFVQEKQTLQYARATFGKPTDLTFQHAQGEDTEDDVGARETLDLLREMCDSTKDDIRPETPREFSSLVFLMKRMNFNGLRRVFNQAQPKNRLCRKNSERISKFVIDALPMVGTGEAVKLMKNLISNEDVTGADADMWLASLAFIHHPTGEMIKEIRELLGLESLSTKVLLPLSTMVHAYCRFNPECAEVDEVKAVINELERNIQGGCNVDQQNFRKIMMSLRALGNTGHAEEAVPSLYNCISNKDNTMDIRVAGVQAFRRLSCGADRNNLMLIYRNPDEDSELRIAAYLAVIQCPTQYVIDQIKETLASEEVNQVGSFVWTHLTNLMESSDPANKYVQQILNDDVLAKEFDLDKRKFSRNYEGSFFLKRLNTGAKIDSNLIWSQKSFVPRSATLNLTVDMFGESMNLFELGGRVEGLEHLFEKYFGPSGYFKNSDKSSENYSPSDPKPAKLSSNKLNDIYKQVKTERDELRGAMYMRMFGNELTYSMFGANNGIDRDLTGSAILDYLQKLRKSEQQDFTFTKSFMFLDSTYTVPTIAGLPLNLTVNGTATVALTAGGHVDFKNPGASIVLEGNFEPSGAIEIESMMSIDAFVTKGGLKMLTTLHTSTGAKGKIELTNRNILDATFDYTKDKSEILDVKTSFFMVYRDFEKEQKMITDKNQESVCSGEKIRKIFGLEFCADMYYSDAGDIEGAPAFPLTGPAGVSVSMYKRDVPNGYKVEVKTIETPQQTLFRFLTDTPGSTVKRAIGLDIDVKYKDKTLMIDLQSPWKTVNVQGELLDSASLKGLTGTINVDDTRKYKLDARIQVDQTKDRMTYTPIINIEIPDWKNVQLNGVLNYQKMKVFDADLTMEGVTDEPVIFQTSIMNTDAQLGATLKFNYEKGEGYVFEAFTTKRVEKKRKSSKASFSPRIYVRTPKEELVEFTGTVDYAEDKAIRADLKLDKLTNKPFTATADLTQVRYKKKGRVKYTARVNVQGPKVMTKVMFTMDSRSWKTILSKCRVDYRFGKGIKDTLVVNQKIKFMDQKIRKSTKITMNTNSLQYNNLDTVFNLNFVKKKYTTVLDTTLRYGRNLKDKNTKNRLDLSVDATHKLEGFKKQVNYSVDFKFPAKDVTIKVEGGHIHTDNTMANDIMVRYHPERTVAMGIRLHNRTTAEDLPNYAGELFIRLPENREVSFSGAFGKENANKYISNIEFELIKGQRSRIDLVLKIAYDEMYEAMVEIHRPEGAMIKLEGGFNWEELGFSTFAMYKHGENISSMSFSTAMKAAQYYKYYLDVNVPSRQVIIHLETSKTDTERNYLVDVKWDANRNIDSRFLLNTTIAFVNIDDFEIVGMLHYPSQTVTLDLKHSAGDRYITHLEITWSPDNVLAASITFRNDQPDIYDRRTELSISFNSPFKNFRELGLEISHIKDKKRYQSKGSITWDKKKKILATATSKVPFDINSMELVGTIKTPFEKYENLNAQLRHHLSDGELETELLFTWGRYRLSFSADGMLEVTDYRRTFNGNFEIRTPWDAMRLLKVTSAHTDDRKKYTTKFTLNSSTQPDQEELDVYIVDIDMDINSKPLEISNIGKIHITMPTDDITTNWEFELKQLIIHAMFHVEPKRGNIFKVQFDNALQFDPVRLFSTKFELNIPTESIKELYITFSHEDRVGYLKTTGLITKDNLELFSAAVDYTRKYGSLEFNTLMKSHYTEDVVLKLTSAHSVMPYRGNAQVQWAPFQQITVDTNFFYNEFGVFDTTVKFFSPFDKFKSIVLKSMRDRRGLNWYTNTELEFAPGQVIVFTSTYRFDHVKYTAITVKTPFPQFPGLDTSFKFEGNIDNLKGDASFTMAPYVNTISTDFKWAYYPRTSLSGDFNLKTPYPSYPYMRAKVNSNALGMSRVSSFEIEYLPTKIIKVTSNYRFTSIETLEGSVTISSPFTEGDLVAGFTHVGNSRHFHTNAKITCKCFSPPVLTDMYFSSRNGLTSTFEMHSPFRGYEIVKWNLSHVGDINDFKTNIEYETNGKKITLNNMFKWKKTVQGQLTLTTPFPNVTKIHSSLLHEGKFPNTKSHVECTFNEKKIEAGLDLAHNPTATEADFQFTSTFPGLDIIKASAHKTGSLSDFTADAELVYNKTWKTSLNHKFDGQDILISGDLKMPYLDDDITFNFTRTGKPLDFIMTTKYAIGSLYTHESLTTLKVDLPNIAYESKATTTVNNEKHVNGLSFYHNQEIDRDIDIKTKLTGNYNEKKGNIDFGFRYEGTPPEGQNYDLAKLLIKVYTIVEIPHPDYQYNRLTYNYNWKKTDGDGMEADGKLEVMSPWIETYREVEKVRSDGTTFRSTKTYSYGEKVWKMEQMYTPGTYVYRLTTPHEGYEDFAVEVNYKLDKGGNGLSFRGDTTVSGTFLKEPVKADINSEFVSVTDTEAIAHFTSPFKGFTSLRAEVRNREYGSDTKPYIKLSLFDETQKFIEVDGNYNLNFRDSSGIVTTGITIQTTFEELRELMAKLEGNMYASPMRAKGNTLIQYNGKKYLDVETEFSTAEKFSGIIDIRAPRQAEFSFRGVNEGESVEGDLLINWNKEDEKSQVRLEFGLADTGDEYTEKKDFHVRLLNPNRIVGYSSKYQRTSEKIFSSAKVTWDEAKKKEASYESEFSWSPVQLSTDYDYSMKVMVPARTLEMSGSYSGESSQKVGNLNLLWDAGNDRGKEVGVKFTVAPYDVQKELQVELNIPSLKKQIIMRTQVTANNDDKLLDGRTDFIYSDDSNKKITAEYSIVRSSEDSISGKWNLTHPDTKTDILLVSSITNTVSKATVDWQLDYLTGKRGRKALSIKTDVDKEDPQFRLEVTTPTEKAALSGHLTTESPYTMVMQASHNAEVMWKTEWMVDTLDRTLKAITTYDKDNMKKEITTSAFFPNETSFVSETNRQTSSGLIEEGRIEGSLNYRLLHGRLKWRPEILKDVTDFGSDYLDRVIEEVDIMMKLVTRELGDELLYKYNTLSNSMSEEMRPLSERFADELSSIQKDVKSMRRELRRMHREDDLYLKTLEQMYSGAVKDMMDGYAVAIAKLKEAYQTIDERIEELTNKIDSYPFQERYNHMMTTVNDKVTEYSRVALEEVDKLLKKVVKALNDLDDLYREAIMDMGKNLKEALGDVFDEMTLRPFLDDLEQIYDKVLAEYPELSTLGEINTDLLDQIQKILTAALETNNLPDMYKTIYLQTKEILADQFGSVIENEDVQQLYIAVVELYDQAAWLYKYTKTDMSLRQLIDKGVEKAREELMKEFGQLPLGLLNLHKSSFTTFDLDNGEIEFDLYLPIPMENFEKLIRFSYEKYIARLKRMLDKYFPRRDFCIWDMYYRLPPVQWSLEKDWMPPFDGYASVYGKQHYTTFDGRHFDLAGVCSYILAADVVDKNFTIVQKYTGGPRKLDRDSLVIMLNGHTFELSPDYMIKIDGQPRDLPYITEKISIIRLGERVIFESQAGVSVLSDFKKNYHFIGLSGWYFGKVAGLLGSYDNEPSNDLTTAEGEVIDNLRKFMNSWEVDDDCKSSNVYTDDEGQVKNEECSDIFEKTSSSLRPCFLLVDPEEFQHSCNIEPESMCDIAALYSQSCTRRGITVQVPQSCVKCEARDNSIYRSGETLKYTRQSGSQSLQTSMDVVFVVEERQCNRDMADKLKEFVYLMDKSLTGTGLADNRYSLIGYAGDSINFHTMEGKIFNDASKFTMGIESLKFVNLGPYTDPLTAVFRAANMPFRTGVSKAIVLVSCSPCTEASGYTYTSLNSVLQRRDITLHILRQTGIQLKNNRSPKTKIYGIDSKNLYSWRQGEDSYSDIEIPTDYCASLAMRTNGSLFDSTNSLEGALRNQRHFMQTVGDRIGMSGSHSQCQECSCELDETGAAVSVCRRCDLKPFYMKPLPVIINGALQAKNQLSHRIETLLF